MSQAPICGVTPGPPHVERGLVENGKEGARAAMQALLLPGQKLHWRDDASRHALIVEAIAALGVEHFVVNSLRARHRRRPERQRRLCLGRLVPELAELGVTRVIAESRGRADDRRDAQAVEHLGEADVSGPFHIDHARGPFDPLLWVPDACCGVITRHRCGDSTHYEKLSTQITMCEWNPRNAKPQALSSGRISWGFTSDTTAMSPATSPTMPGQRR